VTTRKITIFVLLGIVAVITIWDIIAYSNGIEGDTITEVIAQGGTPIAFILGFLGGHLVWPRKGR